MKPTSVENLAAKMLFDSILINMTMLNFASKFNLDGNDETVAYSVAKVFINSAMSAFDLSGNIDKIEEEFDKVVIEHRALWGRERLTDGIEKGIEDIKYLFQEERGNNSTLN